MHDNYHHMKQKTKNGCKRNIQKVGEIIKCGKQTEKKLLPVPFPGLCAGQPLIRRMSASHNLARILLL